MKSKEELSALKEEVETLDKKLSELTEDELEAVVGGGFFGGITKSRQRYYPCNRGTYGLIKIDTEIVGTI